MAETTKLPLNALRVFEAVAQRLSFTEAAESLEVTPAAVSSQIKLLEEYLETPLFHRHSRLVRLTPQGAQLLPGVERGFDELSRAIETLRRHRTSGQLNISVLGSFLQRWLLPRLGDFHLQHPEIDIRFNVSPQLVDFMTTDFHAAVRYGLGDWPGLRSERMLDDWIFPVASPALVEKFGPILTVGDLQKYPLLHSRQEPWSDWLRRLGGDNTRMEQGPLVEDAAALLTAAEQGRGLALARWSLVADDLAAGRLRRAATQSVHQRAAYYLVAPPEYYAIPKVVRFHEWLRACCARFAPPAGELLEAE